MLGRNTRGSSTRIVHLSEAVEASIRQEDRVQVESSHLGWKMRKQDEPPLNRQPLLRQQEAATTGRPSMQELGDMRPQGTGRPLAQEHPKDPTWIRWIDSVGFHGRRASEGDSWESRNLGCSLFRMLQPWRKSERMPELRCSGKSERMHFE